MIKRLLIFGIVVFALWTTWKRWPTLFEHKPSHDVVVENESGSGIEALRLTVDGQTFVAEKLAPGDKADFPFRVGNNSAFTMIWRWSDRMGEGHWSGGFVTVGPIIQRYTMSIDPSGGVLYRAQAKELK